MGSVLTVANGGEDWHIVPDNRTMLVKADQVVVDKAEPTAQPTVKVTRLTGWELVVDEARRTMWKGALGHEPSEKFKMEALMSRHSPIQALIFRIEIKDIPYNVSVHFVRHHVGIAGHWVSSQRPDRSPTGVSRHDLPQDAPVSHDMILNAQEILFISKKRLCMQASPETRAIWKKVVEELRRIGEKELAAFCQPECWWCGNECPESRPCGFCKPKRMPTVE